MLTKDKLRAIYAQHCAGIPAAHADAVKIAMLETAAAQRQADAAAVLAQSGRRQPVCVCGSCCKFIAEVILKGDPK